MRSHIKIVAIVNIVYSVLGLLGAAGVLLGGVFNSIFSGHLIAMIVGSVASVAIALIIGIVSGFGLVAGFGLLNHQQWSRRVIIFVSALRLLRWPFGTLFGGYSLWVLMNDETKLIVDTSHQG